MLARAVEPTAVQAVAMAGNNSLTGLRDQRTPLRADLELSARRYRQMMHLPSINEIRKNRQQAALRARRLLAFMRTKAVGATVDLGGIARLIDDLEVPISDRLSVRILLPSPARAPITSPGLTPDRSAFEFLVSVRLVEVYEKHFGCKAGYRKQFIEFVEQFLVDFNIKKRNGENYSRDSIVKAIADKRGGKIRRKTNRSQLGKIEQK
jgi:hypothetical protein